MKRLTSGLALVSLLLALPQPSPASQEHLLTLHNTSAEYVQFMVYDRSKVNPWKGCIRPHDAEQRNFQGRIMIVTAMAFKEKCNGPGSRLESVKRSDEVKELSVTFEGAPSRYRLRWS